MEYEISLNDLLFYSYHGVMEEERKIGNEFRVNLTILFPCEETIKQDHLSATVSYADLYEIVAAEMAIPRNLLESVEYSIAERIKEKYPKVINGNIKITKLHPPIAGMLGSASVNLKF